MNKQTKKSGRFVEFLTGKGFYVILILCIAAIGVSGYMLVFSNNQNDRESTLDYLDQQVNAEVDLDRATIPDWPPVSSSTPAPTLTPAPNSDDVPVAAITSIPKMEETATPDESKTATTPVAAKAEVSQTTPIPVKASPAPTPKPAPTAYAWPVKGAFVNVFSSDDLVYNKTMGDWRVHLGLDIVGELGTQVMAIAGGTVTDIYDDAFWGTTVIISHPGGISSQYSNLMKKPVVTVGETVKVGQVIGGIGMTAEAERREVNHLHFTMSKDNKPVDPALYLPS